MTPLYVARPSTVGTRQAGSPNGESWRNNPPHPDGNESTLDNAATNWQGAAAGRPIPPLPPRRKPPRLPMRHETSSCVGGGQTKIKPADVRESPLTATAAAPSSAEDDDELRYLELAKLMLAPEGLPLKKVTLEGFSIPVSLRLLDRQRLSLTWLENDLFGFELGGLTIFGRGCRDDADRSTQESDDELQQLRTRDGIAFAGQGSKGISASQGECDGREGSDALRLVLSWASGREAVFQAASLDQRDSLKHCLELLVADIQRLNNSSSSSSSSSSNNNQHLEQHPRRREGLREDTGGDGSANSNAVTPNESEGRIDRQAAALAAAEAGDDDDAPGPLLTLTPGPGSVSDNFREDDSFSSTDAAASPPLLPRGMPRFRSASDAHTRRRTLSLRTPDGKEGSFLAHSYSSIPRLAGAVSMGPRDAGGSSASAEREWDGSRRAEDTMARLLTVYDRAKDECRAATWRVGATRLNRLLSGAATRMTERCWSKWCGAVREANEERQRADRLQWFLHAKANEDNDLLAWYHSTFCQEVYRGRVPFWYRETRLQPYQKAYRIVDDGNSYTPMEKSVMTSCVCTVGTRYPDVAAQLFTAKAVLAAEEHKLFHLLVKRGQEVSKATPKSGKRAPRPMQLRLWFDRGALCLTAKRERQDKSKNMDRSFYLSKVKMCLMMLPASAVKCSFPLRSTTDSGLDSDGRRDPRQVLLPSPVSNRRHGGLVTCFQGFQGGEANMRARARAGGGGGGGGGIGDYGPRSGADFPSQEEPVMCPQRVLSIHFFGRSSTLDLWFPAEAEGAVWQGMLTKLAWKEQGYLYHPSNPDGEAFTDGEEQEEVTATTPSSSFSEGCGVYDDDDVDEEGSLCARRRSSRSSGSRSSEASTTSCSPSDSAYGKVVSVGHSTLVVDYGRS